MLIAVPDLWWNHKKWWRLCNKKVVIVIVIIVFLYIAKNYNITQFNLVLYPQEKEFFFWFWSNIYMPLNVLYDWVSYLQGEKLKQAPHLVYFLLFPSVIIFLSKPLILVQFLGHRLKDILQLYQCIIDMQTTAWIYTQYTYFDKFENIHTPVIMLAQ